MTDCAAADVHIRPWSEGDLWLLQRLLGEPEMTAFIGGPESPEAIAARHERYLTSDPAANGIFAITTGPEQAPVGWVGYWEAEWQGDTVWECGWHVLPEVQRRGVARAGAMLAIDDARARGTHRHLHAFPSVDNAASNALCLTLGFECLGDVEVEYPRGSMMHSNDWRLDLRPGGEGGARSGSVASSPPLECPVCRESLRRNGAAFTCENGHSFDVAKEGYVNLLPPQHRSRGIDGDAPEMLQARRRFLEAGHYAPLLEVLADETDAALARRESVCAPTVIEIGCGEGYYIGGVGERIAGSDAALLGTDLSKAAVKAAARHHPDVLFFVADVHKRIYLADASAAVLLDVFAPRDAAEFARVLEPGGTALVAIPAPAHLAGLREEFGLMDVQADKERLLLERFAGRFTLSDRREVRYRLDLAPEAVRDLIGMGPNARHRAGAPEVTAPVSTEAAFVVLRLVKREGE